MLVQDFYDISEALNGFCKVFGTTDEFRAAHRKRWEKIKTAICRDEPDGVSDFVFVCPFRDLKPKTESLVLNFKKWVTQNYKFPQQ